MFLLHPQIEPWLIPGKNGFKVVLLSERGEALRVQVRCEPDNEALFIDMKLAGREAGLHRFIAEVPWDTGNEPTLYAFKVIEDGRQCWLAGDGLHERVPHRDVMFRLNRNTLPPRWVRDQVFYQIFPDRFCQGDPALQVRSGEYTYGSGRMPVVAKRWGEAIDPDLPATEFYGGDLIGVRRQLDYLQKQLGITAVYLNPIFTSGSNHKYDTEDYYQVDPHLGGNEALAALSSDLKCRGMRLILDAVVNHTGTNHPWFNLYKRHASEGAAHSEASPWRDWYYFDEHGHNHGWKGHASLPVLDYRSESLREQIYGGPDSVLRHWMHAPYSIDGWRFDVIHMLGEGSGSTNNAHYVREFRRALREENPEAYVLGEHFNEATSWLQGDQEDGAMNYYGFAHPVREWLAGTDIAYEPAKLETREFSAWLDSARGRIPYANQLTQFNLLDSHDTARFFTLVGCDTDAMKLAVTLQFAYPGVPSIYYGDEIGLEGGQDPDCRRCFDWEASHWNRDLFEHYKASIALRKAREELRHGAYQALLTEKDTFAFARFTDKAASLYALNRSAEACAIRIPVWKLPLKPKSWVATANEALVSEEGWVTVIVPARSAVSILGEDSQT
jgi:alpha-glucosidase